MKNYKMKTMEDNVKEYYGRIATRESSCCSPQCSTAEISEDPAVFSLGCGIGGVDDAKPGDSVLDIGSGTGYEVFKVAQLVGDDGWVIGVDMTEEMILRAQENATRLDINNVTFKLGNAYELPVENNSIDLVISNCVINLTLDKELTFLEIFRVLKPNGRISVQDVVSEEELPENLKNDKDLWNSCIAGAIPLNKYVDAIKASGLIDVYSEDVEITDNPDIKLLSARFKALKPSV